jgi:hypothetical protein
MHNTHMYVIVQWAKGGGGRRVVTRFGADKPKKMGVRRALAWPKPTS